jgi:hypothetical protein
MRTIIIVVVILLSYSGGFSQVSDSTGYLSVSISQDSYFGFYMGTFGSYKVKERTSLTVYASYWANPAYGTAALGTDFWTEVGGGVDFASRNDKVHFNPTLGIMYGKVLSGGDKGVLGDGIVPTLFLSVNGSTIQTQVFSTYFKSLRNEGPVTTDFIWWWVNSVYSFSRVFKAGVLVDHFYMSRSTGSDPRSLYLWMGPLIQLNFPGDAVFKFSGGYDDVNHEYIKVNLAFPIH